MQESGLNSTKMRFQHDKIATKCDATDTLYDTLEMPGVLRGTPVRHASYAPAYSCDAVDNK
jgi:hypothetical protein